MAFEDLAPTLVSVGVTEEQANVYFENHTPPPAQPAVPTITFARVVAIADMLFDGQHGIADHGGVTGIAQTVGLTTAQTRMIIREIQAAFVEWQSEQ